MTQRAAILLLLREGPKTTAELIRAPYGLAAEFRKWISLIRQDGGDIRYHRLRKDGSCPGCSVMGYEASPNCPAKQRMESCYKLHSEPPVREPNGQLRMALA